MLNISKNNKVQIILFLKIKLTNHYNNKQIYKINFQTNLQSFITQSKFILTFSILIKLFLQKLFL